MALHKSMAVYIHAYTVCGQKSKYWTNSIFDLMVALNEKLVISKVIPINPDGYIKM